MKKNGKTISCAFCQKEFYISGSRIGAKKYCSSECGHKDNLGFAPREKVCIICQKTFLIRSQLRLNDKTCSLECWKKNGYAMSRRRSAERIEKKCDLCGKSYVGLKIYSGRFCKECQHKPFKNRVGEKNPNYRNGPYTHKNNQNRKNSVAYKHLNECRRYKKEFIEKHGYQFCEICGVNKNGTYRFEVHHICSAGRYPKHHNLHDNRNLIHICCDCHRKIHCGSELKDRMEAIKKDRGLDRLFSRAAGLKGVIGGKEPVDLSGCEVVSPDRTATRLSDMEP